MDFKWFTDHNGIITCNWVRFIINDDYGQRSCMFLLLRIRTKRILKDSSNSNRNFGAIIAIVLTQLRSNSAQTATEGGVDEDDDF